MKKIIINYNKKTRKKKLIGSNSSSKLRNETTMNALFATQNCMIKDRNNWLSSLALICFTATVLMRLKNIISEGIKYVHCVDVSTKNIRLRSKNDQIHYIVMKLNITPKYLNFINYFLVWKGKIIVNFL